ncbi:VOC family protein [Kordiimonas aestuarii]|uniref:VOC family protein n=1 Tax=Kordiimonas aestuarii TaxID=1005925 RepID=UPI0021CEC729|nr:VOC family protein [Kordiimonas aestuarii]
MKIKTPITPCLWFDGQAKEAAEFYTSVFSDSKITNVSHYPKTGQDKHGHEPGEIMTVMFELGGQQFMGLNGGPHFKFSEAISLCIMCENQREIDYFWEALTADGGMEVECGWLKDKFGLSWQVMPANIAELIGGDPERSNRVMQVVMSSRKLDIAAMEAA